MIWRLDAGSSQLGPAVLVRGTRTLRARAADGRLVALGEPNTVLLLALERGQAVKATLPADSDSPDDAVLLGHRLAVLTTGRDTSRVALYELADPTPSTPSTTSHLRP